MAGLGDEVVTRCAACGYALTARRYAVPHECPICREPLDTASAATPQDDAETHAQSPPAPEAPHEPAATFAPETPSMNEPEERNQTEADAPHAPSSTSSSPSSRPDDILELPSSRPNEDVTRAHETHASKSPTSGSTSSLFNSTSPSLDVTNVMPPSADTSPLGSVTIPMYEPDARGGPRRTESYTPLDAGELWSDFGGQERSRTEPPRVEPPQRAEPKPQTETQRRAETEPQTEVRKEAASPAASPSSSSTASSFGQSSTLGLSNAPQAPAAPRPKPAPAQATAPSAAPPPFTAPSQPPAQVQPIRAQPLQGEFESRVSPEVVGRYIEAYRAARATMLFGTVIKVLGLLLGLVVAFGPFLLSVITLRQLPPGFGVTLSIGLLSGAGTFMTLLVIGAILSSLGRLRVAALDSAVNTSPFLTNEQRAEVMSLR